MGFFNFFSKKRRVKAKSVRRKAFQDRLTLIWNVSVWGLVVFMCVSTILFFNRLVRRSDFFKITTVQVEGNKRLKQSDVVNLLGIGAQSRMFDIRLNDELTKLTDNPYIRKAIIQRFLPGTLRVTVEEREPFVKLKYRDKFYELDFYGVAVREIDPKELPDIPLIEGIYEVKSDIELGQAVQSNRVERALDVLKMVMKSNIAAVLSIQSINVASLKQITLQTGKGIDIQLGGNDIAQKLQNLSVLITEKIADIENAKYIDLRFGGVIVKPRRAA